MLQNKDEWVVLELTPKGEGEDPDLLRRSIVHSLKGAEVFVPAAVSQVGEDRVIHYLVEGYAFVRRTLPDQIYLKLEGSKYVQTVLTQRSLGIKPIRQISPVPQREIDKMKGQLRCYTEQGIQVGDEVLINSGPYRNMTASIIEEIPELDTVQVFIKLRSKQAIVTLPRSFLKLQARGDGSPIDVRVRAARFREWLRKVQPLMNWKADAISPLLVLYSRWVQIQTWSQSRSKLQRTVDALGAPLDINPILSKSAELSQMFDWTDRGKVISHTVGGLTMDVDFQPSKAKLKELRKVVDLTNRWVNVTKLIQALEGSQDFQPMLDKHKEVDFLQSTIGRLEELDRTVDRVGSLLKTAAETGAGAMNGIMNVVFDGHNLAHRMMHAYASSKLKDAKGRPTEMIFGVLKTLASFKKRYPRATFWVCWDGSDERRRALFPGYKVGRSSSKLDSVQMEFLKEALPFIGVKQAYNSDEEADDLIACLIRGPLKGQSNVIVSTDKDFIQLVTYTDLFLSPKVGSGEEVIYDVDRVVSEFGVEPGRVVQLRALLGDTSDKIPGVPKVPTKILTSLLRAHGTIEGIFSSNLSGVTKLQYDSIKLAENQVRLNVKLMNLLDDLQYTVVDGDLNSEAALTQLQGIDIQPDFLNPFLERASGFIKT